MSYQRLTEQTIANYITSIPMLKQRFPHLDDLEIKEIGDGNLNFVFLVKGGEGVEMVLKQAVPFLRCVGEEYPLAVDRMKYEIRSLNHFNAIVGKRVPTIFYSCEEMSLMVMEYLDEHKILRKELIGGKSFSIFADHITDFMSQTLFKTSSLFLTSHEKRRLMKQFNDNKDLCKLTEDLIFTEPFAHKTHRLITSEVKEKALDLKYKFMNQPEALLHGDLHTGSIMINEEETYVIDTEFAFFGPMGFDIGLLLANVIMNSARHRALENESFANEMGELFVEIWKKFEEKFLALWTDHEESALGAHHFLGKDEFEKYQRHFMQRIFTDTLGYAGCEIIRRLLGLAKVEDIESIEDKALYQETVDGLIHLGAELLLKKEEIKTIDEVHALARGAAV